MIAKLKYWWEGVTGIRAEREAKAKLNKVWKDLLDLIEQDYQRALKQALHRSTNYKVLGLAAGATLADLEAAYKIQALANHPDRGGSVEKMKEINRAYEELKRQL